MSRFRLGGCAVAACALLAALPFGSVAAAQTAAANPPSAEAFAREPAISSVDVSQDGRHIVAVTSADGARRTISVWRTDALDQPPYVIGTDPRSEIVQVQFIKNDRLFVTNQQLTDFNPISGQNERSYAYRNLLLDLEGNPVRTNLEFDGLNRTQQQFIGVGSLVSQLPRDPQSVLVSSPLNGDVYKLNLYTGAAQRTERGNSRFGGLQADLDGNIRARTEIDFDNGAVYFAQWLKDAQGNWAEHFRWYARDREPISIAGFTGDPNIVLVETTKGRDHAAIYEYDIAQRKMSDEPAFAHPLFDATGVIQSARAEDAGAEIGYTYAGERPRTYYVDPAFDQAFKDLRQALNIETVPVDWVDIASGERQRFRVGDGADISIVAASDDRKVLIVEKSGPSTPPEYYVLRDGRIQLIGRAYPELTAAHSRLGEGSLIQYTARDGLPIPAILTKPNPEIFGPGPYPAVITPHGGPWARDDLDWDATGWAQYFAARGYAVLQPQFRGSQGWGQRLWRAGDREWGGKMQDDNDDGARWLIEQGIAAPDRIAMHGYSYGGYAAMMAAVRPNGLYQCAVAGAGPATIDLFKKGTYNNRFLREFQHPTAEGADPLRRINEVSIPIYLYTGDRDTRVIPAESRAFASALERAGKPVQLRILPDMEHTLNTWTPANYAAILTSIEDYYRTGCGPDGL